MSAAPKFGLLETSATLTTLENILTWLTCECSGKLRHGLLSCLHDTTPETTKSKEKPQSLFMSWILTYLNSDINIF